MYACCDKRCELHLAPMPLEDTCFFHHCLLHCTSAGSNLRDQQRRTSIPSHTSCPWPYVGTRGVSSSGWIERCSGSC